MKIVGELRLKESPESELHGRSWPAGSLESRIAARELLKRRKEPQARHVIRFIQVEPQDLPPIPQRTPTVPLPMPEDVPEAVASAIPAEGATLLQQVVLETEEQRLARRRAHGYNGPLLPLANDGGGWWMG